MIARARVSEQLRQRVRRDMERLREREKVDRESCLSLNINYNNNNNNNNNNTQGKPAQPAANQQQRK